MQGVIDAIPPGVGGLWGAVAPPKVSTPFLPGCEKGEVNTKSCFKSAENRAASSLGVAAN